MKGVAVGLLFLVLVFSSFYAHDLLTKDIRNQIIKQECPQGLTNKKAVRG